MAEAIPGEDPLEVDLTVDVNDAFDVLSSERRRTVLKHLSSVAAPVTFEELVDVVREAETPEGPDPEGHRHEIATSLHHVHLPKLAEAGLVEVDAEGGSITPKADVLEAEPFRSLAEPDECHDHR